MMGFTFKWNPLNDPRLTLMTVLIQLTYLYLLFYWEVLESITDNSYCFGSIERSLSNKASMNQPLYYN